MASSTGAATFILLFSFFFIVATADYYVPPPTQPQPYIPKPTTTYTSPKPIPNMAIEGFIFCISDNKTYPIQGAKVKIVCPIVDSYGKLIAKATISSYPTDLNGYFYFIPYGLSQRLKNINSCLVKLESSSPTSTCKSPTNINKGVTGASLSSDNSTFLSDNNLILYTLEPFYFSTPVGLKPANHNIHVQ